MRNILIVIVCAALASILIVVISKWQGVENPTVLGGAVGGAVAAIVCMKLYGRQQKN